MTDNKTLDFSNAPKFIFDFENEHIDSIINLNFGDYNIWQINKISIFYSLLNANANAKETGEEKYLQNRKINKGIFFLFGLFNFLKLIFSNFNKSPDLLLVTNSDDRLSIINGKYFSPLFDPLISLCQKNKLTHWELINNSKKPTFTKPSNNIANIEVIANRFIVIKNYNQENISKFLELWNEYCLKHNVFNNLNKSLVLNNCNNFYKHYIFWKFILKLVRPKKIFCSEKVGTGFMAAANYLGIPIFEFQHGSIDKYYPPYVWSSDYNNLKKTIKPNKLIVFGDFAKQIISNTGYFHKDQIYEIGYCKIDDFRKLKVKNKGTVFFAFQPMMHELNLQIINTIVELRNKFPISIKFHPLQKEYEIRQYLLLLKDQEALIYGNDKNIYECILESEIIVSHTSTVLEESLSLGKVSITISTPNLIYGIHSMTGNKSLVNVILPLNLNEIESYLSKFFFNSEFKNNEIKKVEKFKDLIYSKNYLNNAKKLISDDCCLY